MLEKQIQYYRLKVLFRYEKLIRKILSLEFHRPRHILEKS